MNTLQRKKQLTYYCELLPIASRRPILAGGDPPTTFGATELNYCVRYGNRCDLSAIITTRFLLSELSSLKTES